MSHEYLIINLATAICFYYQNYYYNIRSYFVVQPLHFTDENM